MDNEPRLSIDPAYDQVDEERCWTARIAFETHGMSLSQIARLMACPVGVVEAWAKHGAWVEEDSAMRIAAIEKAGEAAASLAALTARMAAMIDADLKRLSAEGEALDVEKRARAYTALFKQMRELEAMAQELEKAAHAQEYPTDVVDFGHRIERRLDALSRKPDRRRAAPPVERR